MAEQTTPEVDDDNSDDLQRVIAELGGDTEGATLCLLRLEKAGARTGLILPDMEISDFSYAEVRRRHGGGHYRAKLAAANGRLIRNKAFSFEGKPKIEEDNPTPPPQNHQRDTDPAAAMMQMQIQMMQQAQKDTQQVMRELLGTLAHRSPSPAPAPFGPQEMIGMIAALMPLFSQKAAGDPMAPFIKGLELGQGMAAKSGGEDDESPLAILSKGFDTFGPLVSKIVSTPAPPPPVPRRSSRPPAQNHPAQVENQMTPEQKEIYSMMKLLAGAALESAAADDPPEKLVSQYGGMVPSMYHKALTDPGIVDALVRVEPLLETHRGWLAGLREAFRASYASPLDRAEDVGIKVDYGPPAS